MTNIRTIDGETHNFGPLQDPGEHGNIRVVCTPRGEEIHFVRSPAGVI